MISQKTILIIVAIVILYSVVFSVYTWMKAENWADTLVADEQGWYENPELSRMEMRDAYDRAYKRIMVTNFVLFASLFALIKVFEYKK